jgi:hypothetical protein
MSDTTDETAGTTPGQTPPHHPEAQAIADQTPPAVQAPPAPQPVAYAAPREPGHLHRHWALIVGAVAVALILLFGGVAIGAVVGGHHDWGDRHGRMDRPFGRGDDGQRGQMYGPGGQGNGVCPGVNGGQGNGGYAPGYGQPGDQPGVQPAPGSSAAPETAPTQPATP